MTRLTYGLAQSINMLFPAIASLGSLIVLAILFIATATMYVRRMGGRSVGSVDNRYDEECAGRIEERLIEDWESTRDT
jgi:hypothetical protein